jgi:hypothetical protein
MATSTGTAPLVIKELEARVLREGYGPGAWHGPDLKAALADVTPELAFWRPAAGRHNIAEIALHHAYYARAVRAQVSEQPADPFIVEGDDWFELTNEGELSWDAIRAAVDAEQVRLERLIGGIDTDSSKDDERFGLVLGITCHAVYHAGQVQLIKKLHGG